jgi:hypothetical protein
MDPDKPVPAKPKSLFIGELNFSDLIFSEWFRVQRFGLNKLKQLVSNGPGQHLE